MLAALCPAGGALWGALSRRALLFALFACALWCAPLPAPALQLLGRALCTLVGGAVAARLLAPLLPRPTLPLDGRAVLVTGCSSGFGRAVALALDAAGVLVLAAVRDPEGDGALRLRRDASPRLRLLRMDVRDDASVADAVAAARQALGHSQLWAVVNNAGVLGVGECEWMDMADVRNTLETNSFGPLRVTRAFLPLLRESRGRVVNIVSILCRASLAGVVPYCMSKYTTLALTEALRHELWRFGISVHSIEPWFYKTPMIENRKSKLIETWDKAPDHVKETYGYDYIEKMQGSSDVLMSLVMFPESKVSLVADTVFDACFARDPKSRYIPSFIAEIAVAVLQCVPFLIPLLHQIILPSIGKKKTS